MELLKNVKSIRIVTKKIFLHLYGFMLLSGCVESDNHNGAFERCEKCSDSYKENIFELEWLHALKW